MTCLVFEVIILNTGISIVFKLKTAKLKEDLRGEDLSAEHIYVHVKLTGK